MVRQIWNGLYLLNILQPKETDVQTRNKYLSGFNINQHVLWHLHMIYIHFVSLVQDAKPFVITV